MLFAILFASLLVGSQSNAAQVPGGATLAADFASRPAAATVAPNQVLHLSFELRGNDSALDSYLEDVYNPSSPNYHHWVTPQQFGRQFGASSAEIAAVTAWIKSSGMTITAVWPNNRFLSAKTTAARAQALFGVHLRCYYQSAGGTPSSTVFIPDAEPSVRDDIAAKLVSITGLTNAMRAVAPRLQICPTASNPAIKTLDTVAPLVDPLSPAQLSTIYDLGRIQSAGFTGSLMRIGVYSPTLYYVANTRAFESYYGISAPTPIEEWPTSTGRTTDDSGSQEADLDVQTLIGQAPNAQLVLYEAPNDGSAYSDQFNQIASDDPPVVSMSYSFPESTSDASALKQLDTIVKEMAAQGETVVGATGDTGPYDNGGTTPSVGYPASSAYALGVGGSALVNTDNGYWDGEIYWNDKYGMGGGGNSILFSIPSWQTGSGVDNSSSDGFRQVPDVCSLAGNPGLNIYSSNTDGSDPGWATYGGTSTATPIWAAALLDIDQAIGTSQGNVDPTLYTIANDSNEYAAAFHDITSGSNQLFSATTGWDYCTGLGSGDFYEIYLFMNGTSLIHAYPHGLQMISVPYTYTGITGIFDSTPTLAAYDTATGQYVVSPNAPANLVQAGQGYWVRAGEPINLLTAGTPVTANPFSVALSAGWNLIGDPYSTAYSIAAIDVLASGSTTPVSWTSAVASGIVDNALYTYPAGSSAYTAIDSSFSMQPFAGYWIYANQACTLEFSGN
jgi:kumamolisin